MTLTKERKDKFVEYLTEDPLHVSKHIFKSRLWDKQQEIIKSVWEHKRTAVKSCNAGGKSRIAAEIALIYLLTFRPSRVVTTAPTFLQVCDILWKEIHALWHKSVLASSSAKLNQTSIEMGTVKGQPWDATGISTDEINRFQGWHSPHLLVILDEALGVSPEIWEAMEGLHPHRVLVIGNPLESAGDFYNCFQSDLYNKITINGYDCVKWQEENGRIPGLITREWIEERRADWGDGSPQFEARVLGEFPEDAVGTLIARKWVEDARKRQIDEDIDVEDSLKVVACDVATKHGDCETVVGYRVGHTLKEIVAHKNIPTTSTAGILKRYYEDKKSDVLVVDSDGVGEGVSDILQEQHIGVVEFHGGYASKAIDINRFKNLRSQFYWIVAKKFEKGLYSLKDIPEKEYEILKNQLCCIKQKAPDSQGRIQIETKEDLASRQIKSPDYADFFVYAEYGFWSGRQSDIKPYRWR